MSDIQRYYISWCNDYTIDEEVRDDGEWVKYDDYVAAISERDAEIQRLQQLSQAKDEYIEILGDELESTVPLAYHHGWRSTLHDAGVEARKKIQELEVSP